jgi:hypothetical protein
MKKVRFFSTVVLILFLSGILLSAASAARGSEGRRDLRARADLPAAALRRNAQRIDERAKTAAAEEWIRGRG